MSSSAAPGLPERSSPDAAPSSPAGRRRKSRKSREATAARARSTVSAGAKPPATGLGARTRRRPGPPAASIAATAPSRWSGWPIEPWARVATGRAGDAAQAGSRASRAAAARSSPAPAARASTRTGRSAARSAASSPSSAAASASETTRTSGPAARRSAAESSSQESAPKVAISASARERSAGPEAPSSIRARRVTRAAATASRARPSAKPRASATASPVASTVTGTAKASYGKVAPQAAARAPSTSPRPPLARGPEPGAVPAAPSPPASGPPRRSRRSATARAASTSRRRRATSTRSSAAAGSAGCRALSTRRARSARSASGSPRVPRPRARASRSRSGRARARPPWIASARSSRRRSRSSTRAVATGARWKARAPSAWRTAIASPDPASAPWAAPSGARDDPGRRAPASEPTSGCRRARSTVAGAGSGELGRQAPEAARVARAHRRVGRHLQGARLALGDAQATPLAGVRVDGQEEELAAALRLRLGSVEERGGASERHLADLGDHRLEGLDDGGLALFGERRLGHRRLERGAEQRAGRAAAGRGGRQLEAQRLGELAGGHPQGVSRGAAPLGEGHAPLEEGAGADDHRRQGAVGAGGPAGAAAGAGFRGEGGQLGPRRGDLAERSRQRRQRAGGEIGVGRQLAGAAAAVEDAHLVPEPGQAVDGRSGRGGAAAADRRGHLVGLRRRTVPHGEAGDRHRVDAIEARLEGGEAVLDRARGRHLRAGPRLEQRPARIEELPGFRREASLGDQHSEEGTRQQVGELVLLRSAGIGGLGLQGVEGDPSGLRRLAEHRGQRRPPVGPVTSGRGHQDGRTGRQVGRELGRRGRTRRAPERHVDQRVVAGIRRTGPRRVRFRRRPEQALGDPLAPAPARAPGPHAAARDLVEEGRRGRDERPAAPAREAVGGDGQRALRPEVRRPSVRSARLPGPEASGRLGIGGAQGAQGVEEDLALGQGAGLAGEGGVERDPEGDRAPGGGSVRRELPAGCREIGRRERGAPQAIDQAGDPRHGRRGGSAAGLRSRGQGFADRRRERPVAAERGVRALQHGHRGSALDPRRELAGRKRLECHDAGHRDLRPALLRVEEPGHRRGGGDRRSLGDDDQGGALPGPFRSPRREGVKGPSGLRGPGRAGLAEELRDRRLEVGAAPGGGQGLDLGRPRGTRRHRPFGVVPAGQAPAVPAEEHLLGRGARVHPVAGAA